MAWREEVFRTDRIPVQTERIEKDARLCVCVLIPRNFTNMAEFFCVLLMALGRT